MYRPHPPCILAAHGRSFLHPGACAASRVETLVLTWQQANTNTEVA